MLRAGCGGGPRLQNHLRRGQVGGCRWVPARLRPGGRSAVCLGPGEQTEQLASQRRPRSPASRPSKLNYLHPGAGRGTRRTVTSQGLLRLPRSAKTRVPAGHAACLTARSKGCSSPASCPLLPQLLRAACMDSGPAWLRSRDAHRGHVGAGAESRLPGHGWSLLAWADNRFPRGFPSLARPQGSR